MRFQVMSPHENHNHSLREMDALLQEMSHLNAGHAPDQLPPGLGPNMLTNLYNKARGIQTDWEKLTPQDKSAKLQQVYFDIAIALGGWPNTSLDKMHKLIEGNGDAAPHLTTSKTFQVTQNAETKKYTIQEL